MVGLTSAFLRIFECCGRMARKKGHPSTSLGSEIQLVKEEKMDRLNNTLPRGRQQVDRVGLERSHPRLSLSKRSRDRPAIGSIDDVSAPKEYNLLSFFHLLLCAAP